jgi:hypothetical protein
MKKEGNLEMDHRGALTTLDQGKEQKWKIRPVPQACNAKDFWWG